MKLMQRAISYFVAAVGFIAAIVGLSDAIIEESQTSAFIAIALVSALIAFLIGYLTYNILSYFSFRKLRKLERNQKTLHDIIRSQSEIFGFEGFSKHVSDETHQTLNKYITTLLDSYKSLMEEESQRKVRVGIKIFTPNENGDDIIVVDIVRDSKSAETMAEHDRAAFISGANSIQKNSIVNEALVSFETKVNNNTQKSLPYQKTPTWKIWSRKDKWLINYNSILVIPIKDQTDNQQRTVMGGLVFDSVNNNVFGKKEIELAEFLSEQLALHIKNLLKWHNTSEQKE